LGERGWPEVGELVVATVRRITRYGAYVLLDEYGREGLLHNSEISSTWFRNIREFVREGQKVILKVLRVDPGKGHVDLSLRRVSGPERREKLLYWKRSKKAEGLLRSASEKLGVPLGEIQARAGALIEKEFGLYEGLERAAREGAGVLLGLGVPKEMATTLAEVAREKIRRPAVEVKGTLELQCPRPNGVVLIREALTSAKGVKRPQDSQVDVYVVAAPKYRIEVRAENYREAEQVLKESTEAALRSITEAGGQGTFQREK